MKIYNPNTFTKLGFDVILKQVEALAVSEDAKAACAEIVPTADAAFLQNELQKVLEFRDLLTYDESFPFSGFSSVGYVLSKAAINGNWLNVEELNRIYKWLQIIKMVRGFITKRKEKYPSLNQLVGELPFAEYIITAIEKVLDPYGNMRDDASPELKIIRRQMQSVSVELRTTLNRILRYANENGWSIEKEITLRNDRLVIPLKADSKGRIPGFIQDISQSGQTIFVEPTESLVLNNKLRELQLLENNEIIRILTEITAKIGENIEMLVAFKDIITEIDIIRAKALLAKKLNANLPKFYPEGTKTHIMEGKYPVLQLRAMQQGLEVVPLTLMMDKKPRIIVISGPNAGGKSVSLKTVGLLQIMLQSGFLIPVDERSTFRMFDSLFIDLGDEQSVENDLSTYTSHLYQMRQMGDNMTHNSLFLIDEFGGGTDPKLGGAIAEAFLERFLRQGAYGVITTHYGNLKEYAQTHDGIGNAAMEFDTLELKPTYRLLYGIPGRSYAFEIAERVGVHRTIVSKAKSKIGKEQVNTEQLISDLEKKNIELAKLVTENTRKAAEMDKSHRKYEELRDKLKNDRQSLIAQAKLEAQKIIEDANRKVENTIREIREHQAEKEITKKLRKALEDAAPILSEEEMPAVKDKKETGFVILQNEVPVVGDWVKLKQGESFGKLVEVSGQKCVVEIGELRTSLKINQIVKIIMPEGADTLKHKPRILKVDKIKSVGVKVDVLGMRVEEALPLIDKKIDDAVWAGLSALSILHGKGTGTLRDAIRKHLRDLHVVASLESAPEDEGGSGWTIVRFR